MRPTESNVEVRRGTAADLHAYDPFVDDPGSGIRWLIGELTAPAIVLGSRQDPTILDRVACDRAGLEIVRRRSGGGVVVLRPGEIVWIDALIPVDDGDVPDDVRGSMIWAGERWRAALTPLVGRGMVVHRGGMVDTEWSDLVCFAGVGPGEVLLGGRKLVGLSQRRTRRGIRIQGLVHRDGASFDADADLFAAPVAGVGLTSPATLPAGASATSIADALTRVVPA